MEKHRGMNGCWKPLREVAAPKRYDDVAVVALTCNSLHAQERVAPDLCCLTSLG
jgi:hypothetical protein